jgi:probable HAF family extracellular repeat protein
MMRCLALAAASVAFAGCAEPLRPGGEDPGPTAPMLVVSSSGFTVVDLGTLGGTSSAAYAINDNGEIVGASTGRAFFRTAGGTMVDIGPGGAEDVNNSRQVVGYASGSAFLRSVDANGAVTSAIDLGTGVARAVNDAGVVAGGDSGLAVVWIAPPARVKLPTLGGFSEAYDVSEDTVVVGASHHDHAGTDIEHAVRWTRAVVNGASVWVLDTLDQTDPSEVAAAWAVNLGGNIAGSGRPCLDDSSAACLGPRAYLWPAAGGRLELPTLGGVRRAAYDVNDGGNAVGWSYDKTGTKKRAVLWPAGGGVEDLGASRKATGAEARAINSDGKIVGFTEFTGGTKRATLWLLQSGSSSQPGGEPTGPEP